MRWNNQSMSPPKLETFSGSHQLSMSSSVVLADYFFTISTVTFVVAPGLTSTSFVTLPSFSCHTSTVCLPAGAFSIFAIPLSLVTAKYGCGITAIQPIIHECTSHVTLMTSGLSNFSVIVFLNFGCALLMEGFAVEYVWMLWRIPSELR